MHTKRTTFPTKTKIGVYLEEVKHRNRNLYIIRVFSNQKNNVFADLYRMNWRKRYFDAISYVILMQSHTIVPYICSSRELENILRTNYG